MQGMSVGMSPHQSDTQQAKVAMETPAQADGDWNFCLVVCGNLFVEIDSHLLQSQSTTRYQL